MREKFMDNHDDQFLIKILDDAISEILVLLDGSWRQFKRVSYNLDDIVYRDRTDVNEQIMIAMHQEITK